MYHVTHANESCPTYECIMSHMRMSHVPHMNVSCHTCECSTMADMNECVTSNLWMYHVTHANESCLTQSWCFIKWHTHEWMSHVADVESCRTYAWVMLPIWMNHVTRRVGAPTICMHSHMWMHECWVDWHMRKTHFLNEFSTPHVSSHAASSHISSMVRHHSCIRMCDCMRWDIWVCSTHDSLVRETWLIGTWDMTHWYVRHDSLVRETWLIGFLEHLSM